MERKQIADGARVKVIKIHEGDCYSDEADATKFFGELATVVAHFPDSTQEEGTNGTRGGCTLDYDKTMGEIFGYDGQIPDDHCMVFADVEIEEVE